MKDLLITKIGGNVINEENELKKFLEVFSTISGDKILVHGGGKIASEMCSELNIQSKIVDGRRITDAETLKVVTMVYGGLLNKNIVATLQKHGCNAIGLTGADGNIIRAHKRKSKEIDFGFVGDIDCVNGNLIHQFIANGLTPILAPLTADTNGQILNTNADTIASEVASEMSNYCKVKLVYVFEKKGLLQDVNDEDSVIHEISFEKDYSRLLNEKIISDGMLVKVHNIERAIQNGVDQIALVHAKELTNYLNGDKLGTTFTK